MDVIVIGYGKIGRMKSFLWRSLGKNVFIQDVDEAKKRLASDEGFNLVKKDTMLSDGWIGDISTPAGTHYAVVKELLASHISKPRLILVEKPLVSTKDEAAGFKRLLSAKKVPIYVDESYYFSAALSRVKQHLDKNGLKILSIEVELSKNRLEDVVTGRFVDSYLGPFGIELPHALAIVQSFGLDLAAFKGSAEYFMGTRAHDEGLRVTGSISGIEVQIASYLGSFRVDNEGSVAPNDLIVRTARIVTDAGIYEIAFDPVSGEERFYSKISMPTGDGEETIVEDDHLLLLLHHVSKDNYSEAGLSRINSDNALELAQFLINIKKGAELKQLSKEGIIVSVNSSIKPAVTRRHHGN